MQYSFGVVSNTNLSVGKYGIKSRKGITSFLHAGSLLLIDSIFNMAKKRSFSLGFLTCPKAKSPVFNENFLICDGLKYISSEQGK